MHLKSPSFIFLVFIGLLVVHTSASAKVYKCKNAAGEITYSQVPCESDSSQKTITGPAKNRPGENVCSYLADVAVGFHRQMSQGRDAGSLIDEHGSLSGINPRLLNLINYVSGFRFNKDVSAKRIGQLSLLKCRNGGFGVVSLDDLPVDPEERMRHEMMQARQKAMQPLPVQQQKSISVSFANTPVETAIKEIANKAGVPIKIHGKLAGMVSMQLDNVPWQQPLTAIVLQHNFEMGGGVEGIWISPR